MMSVTSDLLQNAIAVTSIGGFRSLLDPAADTGGLTLGQVGAVISVEHATPDFSAPEDWHAPRLHHYGFAQNIPQHFTRLFYNDGSSAGRDYRLGKLFERDDICDVLAQKEAEFYEALDFADGLIHPQWGKKLLIHCFHGANRSVMLALGINAAALGPGREGEACLLLFGQCVSRQPELRAGELAFADHCLGRDGALVAAWARADRNYSYFPSFDSCAADTFLRRIKAIAPAHTPRRVASGFTPA